NLPAKHTSIWARTGSCPREQGRGSRGQVDYGNGRQPVDVVTSSAPRHVHDSPSCVRVVVNLALTSVPCSAFWFSPVSGRLTVTSISFVSPGATVPKLAGPCFS